MQPCRDDQQWRSGTQHNMGWQTCTVTADSWLGPQNVCFRVGASLVHMGWLWVCENQGWPYLPCNWTGHCHR